MHSAQCSTQSLSPALMELGSGPQESAAIYAGDASGRANRYPNFLLNVSSFTTWKAKVLFSYS